MSEPLAPLRAVEVIPTKHEGQTVMVLRDPEGICDGLIVLPLPAFYIAASFDGASRIADIQASFQQQFGQLVKAEDIVALNRQLDERALLLSPRYFEQRRKMEEEYEALPIRPVSHAGEAYPDEPEALKAVFREYFTSEGGAGALPDGRADAPHANREIAGLVLPHIDPRCGGRCASWALKELAQARPVDTFVILGTSHHALPELFSVSDKDFATPLGTVEVDREFVKALRSHWPAGRFSGGALIHKNEHSIEFQVMFLHALYGDERPFRIVPILCGSLHEFMEAPDQLTRSQDLEDFCAAIEKTVASSGKRICFVAGADLAHMGRKFGDEFGLSDELLARTKSHDLAALDCAAKLDASAFFESIARNGDEYKICGLPPIYAMLRCMKASQGKMLRYDYNLEAATDSMVSFCSMAFYK